MQDLLGREIDHLRISVTNRCNLDCFYCHREGNDEGPEMPLSKILSIINDASDSGIKTIKLTGGEPLLRDDLPDIIRQAKALGMQVGLTTNGTMLSEKAMELKKAGLERVNIGCDSVSGVLPKNTEKLKLGILAATSAGLITKLNMVVLKGINESEVWGMLDFCRLHNVNLQLIELIGLNNDYSRHVPLDDIEKKLGAKSDFSRQRKMQGRKRYYFGEMFVETVRPNPGFCAKCNKLRVTATGKLKPCLVREALVDYKSSKSFAKACGARDAYGYG